MQDLNSYRYTPHKTHRGAGILIVILALFCAVLIPVGAYFIKEYYVSAESEPESSSQSEASSEESESSGEPEESAGSTKSAAEPEPEAFTAVVPESDAVEQSYFDDAVFFGDSITDGISHYSLMSNAKVIAFTGINPDSALKKAVISVEGSESRITMIDALNAAAPQKIYIMLGANWVGGNTGISEETFLSHYRTLLERIKADHPDSVIYVQSMFPVSKAFETNENGKNVVGLTNAMIQEYNGALSKLTEDLGLYFLDLFPYMANEQGYLPDDMTSDGMHITPAYYERWFDYLKTHTVPGTGIKTEDRAQESKEPQEEEESADPNSGEQGGQEEAGPVVL